MKKKRMENGPLLKKELIVCQDLNKVSLKNVYGPSVVVRRRCPCFASK